jgi:putative protease
VEEALKEVHAAGARLVVITPRITKRREMRELSQWFLKLDRMQVDGLMVSNWGMWKLARETTALPLYGNYSLNLTNSQTANLASEMGLTQGAVSLELSALSLQGLLQNTGLSTEVVVHGVLSGMILEFCLPSAMEQRIAGDQAGVVTGQKSGLVLQDECGQRYPVEVDQFGRTHLQLPYQLCLLSILPWLVQVGPASLRIEAQNYDQAEVGQVVRIYRKYLDLAINHPQSFLVSREDWDCLRKISPPGYTLGALGA